jgi:hypothetical protein
MVRRVLSSSLCAIALCGTAMAGTYFSANFDNVVVGDYGGGIGYGAHLNQTNLNAGTAIGSWTVNVNQAAPTMRTSKMIQADNGLNVANKALRFGIAFDGTSSTSNPYLTANMSTGLGLANDISVAFDYGYISTDGSSDRLTYLTGRDAANNRLFQIGFVNESIPGGQVGYFTQGGAWTLIGSAGDIIGNNNTYWNSSLMNRVSIEIGAAGYDIVVDSATLASGLAFRDAAAGGLSTIEFSTNGQRFTGGAFDNMLVSQIPEPSTTALLGLGMGCLLLGRRR